jgi:alkylmercury lyase
LPAERRECLRETFCEQSLFFENEQAASRWLPAHPGALILSVEEAALVGSIVASRRFTTERKGSVERS